MPQFEKKSVSMEELFEIRASSAMVSEANAFKTVPKGTYRLRATKYDTSEGETQAFTKADGTSRGRYSTWFSVDILDKEGNRKAKGSVKVSPDEVRTAKGYQDTQTQLYGQLTKALGLQPENGGEQPTLSEVIQVFMTTPVDGFITLTFKGPKDPMTGYPSWNDPANEAEEAQFRASGYTPTNIIRSIRKAAS
jgi:hypothetical protein